MTMEEQRQGSKGLTEWVGDHPAPVRLFLLALAALNGWISYVIFAQHPVMTVLNGAMALILALGVIVTWQKG